MKKYYIVLLSAFFITLSGCATVTGDIQVESELVPNVKWSSYKTYDWLSAFEAVKDPNNSWKAPDIDITGDIKYLIDRELRNRNINSSAGVPDLAVSFFIGVDMEHKEHQLDPETKIKLNKKIPKGALVVVLIDVKSGEVVWMGNAVADIQENASNDLVRQRLDYAINEMFKTLP